ncbi:MAG: homocysteine S-methyltransferase family protein [Ignavibacteriae bacterium]|nr:homocysteine S-methyltransferase family protein [Ignavibacteriota bacterium]
MNLNTQSNSGPVLLDGAWGTELQKRGLPVGACPDLWNVEFPELVAGVARSYVQAGSAIILTNTFGANAIVLARHGLSDRAAELARAGAEISRAEAGSEVRVFGSMGSTGALLLMGEVSEVELAEVYLTQARALAEGGVDALLLETMTDLDETLIALAAAKSTGLPVAVSMVFDSGEDGASTMMGLHARDAAAELERAGADIIGANCGTGITDALPVCRILRAGTTRPVWMKPNAGLPEISDGRILYSATPESFAAGIRALVDAGASYVGGCCGTTPEHIARAWAELQKVDG